MSHDHIADLGCIFLANEGGCRLILHKTQQHRATANMSPPDHLIVVCGHAIWLGGPENGYDESEWLIESYKAGETPTFIDHIRAGVRLLSQDENAILVFSG